MKYKQQRFKSQQVEAKRLEDIKAIKTENILSIKYLVSPISANKVRRPPETLQPNSSLICGLTKIN